MSPTKAPIKPGLSDPAKPDLSKLEAAIVDKLRREVDAQIAASFRALREVLTATAKHEWQWGNARLPVNVQTWEIKSLLGEMQKALVAEITKARSHDYINEFIKKVEVLG